MITAAWRPQANPNVLLPTLGVMQSNIEESLRERGDSSPHEPPRSGKRKRDIVDTEPIAGPSRYAAASTEEVLTVSPSDVQGGGTKASSSRKVRVIISLRWRKTDDIAAQGLRKQHRVAQCLEDVFHGRTKCRLCGQLYHRWQAINSLVVALSDSTFVPVNIPEMLDKHRIQLVAHEIWRATGYRFTYVLLSQLFAATSQASLTRIKDHPPIKDGHKTRMWCSQDEARKHKPRSNDVRTRMTATGDNLAKSRYPCRSRLLVSSRDANVSGYRIVTIRMHHHCPHEAYYDNSVAPGVVRAVWGNPVWHPVMMVSQSQAPMYIMGPQIDMPVQSPVSTAAGEPAFISDEEDDPPPGMTPDIFQRRMRAVRVSILQSSRVFRLILQLSAYQQNSRLL